MSVTLEQIVRRHFPQADRAFVQESVARQVERAPELYLARYCKDPRSMGGRYVNSDLFKETFAEYNTSNESRGRYNAPVHNAAAVLASEQFRRVVSDNSEPYRDNALFLSGVPGAGKSSYVLRANSPFPNNLRVLYEGQLSNAGQAISKINQVIEAGLAPEITIVHISSEQALHNTIHRFYLQGRGASIEAIASIQGRLSHGLRAVHERFGNAVKLHIIDRRGTLDAVLLHGWRHLPILESEGTYEDIKRKLTENLERDYRSSDISENAYEQAIGKAPRDFTRRVARERSRGFER